MVHDTDDTRPSTMILAGLLVLLLGSWLVFGYLALLMALIGDGTEATVVFVGTLLVIGLWVVLDRMTLPWLFRQVLVGGYARKRGWRWTRNAAEAAELSSLDLPERRGGSRLTANLFLDGETGGRRFEATQISKRTGAAESANVRLMSHVWVATGGDLPVDAVRFRPVRGTVSVRSERHPEVAAAIERSEFARWMRRHRILARSIRVERGGVAATWRHGLYGAKLQRKVRFLTGAADRLASAASVGSPEQP